MNRALIFKIAFVLILSGCKQQSENPSAQNELNNKPNIVFLFTDDQSFKAVHALGNQEIRTPTMDKLVQEGVTFTRPGHASCKRRIMIPT